MNTNLAREEVVNNVVANLYALPTVTKETTGLHKQEETLGYKISKRIVDIIGAMFGIVMLLPMTIGVYIANLIVGDNGPIFYSQNRIGKDGKIFKEIHKGNDSRKEFFDKIIDVVTLLGGDLNDAL